MQKHEWRKKEKQYYLPKAKPELIDIPSFQFVTLSGAGNPNSAAFAECIRALYSISYAIKMKSKRMNPLPIGHMDYIVYPLEGVWDVSDEAKRENRAFNKDDLVFKIMIRQPGFVDESLFQKVLALTKAKKPHPLLGQLQFESITDGKCVQMLHVGPYDDEPASFQLMEEFASSQQLKRLSKTHREIYLSDFRKVAPEKLKTVLRFKVAQA